MVYWSFPDRSTCLSSKPYGKPRTPGSREIAVHLIPDDQCGGLIGGKVFGGKEVDNPEMTIDGDILNHPILPPPRPLSAVLSPLLANCDRLGRNLHALESHVYCLRLRRERMHGVYEAARLIVTLRVSLHCLVPSGLATDHGQQQR